MVFNGIFIYELILPIFNTKFLQLPDKYFDQIWFPKVVSLTPNFAFNWPTEKQTYIARSAHIGFLDEYFDMGIANLKYPIYLIFLYVVGFLT